MGREWVKRKTNTLAYLSVTCKPVQRSVSEVSVKHYRRYKHAAEPRISARKGHDIYKGCRGLQLWPAVRSRPQHKHRNRGISVIGNVGLCVRRHRSGPHPAPAYTAAVILHPHYAREQLEVTLIHRDTYMTALVLMLSVVRRSNFENLLTIGTKLGGGKWI